MRTKSRKLIVIPEVATEEVTTYIAKRLKVSADRALPVLASHSADPSIKFICCVFNMFDDTWEEVDARWDAELNSNTALQTVVQNAKNAGIPTDCFYICSHDEKACSIFDRLGALGFKVEGRRGGAKPNGIFS